MDRLNSLGERREPFLFIIDYDKNQIVVELLSKKSDYKYYIDGLTNTQKSSEKKSIRLDSYPLSFEEYKIRFDKIIEQIKLGNTYLLNFTIPTPITIDATFEEIYNNSTAPFKLFNKDFVCFSPERFVKIENNKIYTYPMKGTIDATIKNAKEQLLKSKKELAEHTMIVDLLRNDLSIIATKVKVERFRYIDKVNTSTNTLYQTSSCISGNLDKNWHENIGDILSSILPAGSITGTPKHQTVKIIDNIEKYSRGFYTGVFGVYDGVNLDSAVLIRYIEHNENQFIYKSGGGITIDSIAKDEYEEMIKKIYV